MIFFAENSNQTVSFSPLFTETFLLLKKEQEMLLAGFKKRENFIMIELQDRKMRAKRIIKAITDSEDADDLKEAKKKQLEIENMEVDYKLRKLHLAADFANDKIRLINNILNISSLDINYLRILLTIKGASLLKKESRSQAYFTIIIADLKTEKKQYLKIIEDSSRQGESYPQFPLRLDETEKNLTEAKEAFEKQKTLFRLKDTEAQLLKTEEFHKEEVIAENVFFENLVLLKKAFKIQKAELKERKKNILNEKSKIILRACLSVLREKKDFPELKISKREAFLSFIEEQFESCKIIQKINLELLTRKIEPLIEARKILKRNLKNRSIEAGQKEIEKIELQRTGIQLEKLYKKEAFLLEKIGLAKDILEILKNKAPLLEKFKSITDKIGDKKSLYLSTDYTIDVFELLAKEGDVKLPEEREILELKKARSDCLSKVTQKERLNFFLTEKRFMDQKVLEEACFELEKIESRLSEFERNNPNNAQEKIFAETRNQEIINDFKCRFEYEMSGREFTRDRRELQKKEKTLSLRESEVRKEQAKTYLAAEKIAKEKNR